MRPFEELTPAGRARRLRSLAKPVLDQQYDMPSARMRLLSVHSFNTIFRIDSKRGRFALRVGDTYRIHPPGVEDVEAQWLDALAGDHNVPRNVPTTSGTRWAASTAPDVPGQRVCTLFTWVEGRQLRDRFTLESAEMAGRLLGSLHRSARELDTATPDALMARRAIYFGDADLVTTYRSDHGALFREATQRVQEHIDEIWRLAPAEPHLLHGDFGPHNILINRSTLTPIDFQDLRLGHAVQDLGITLADLGRSSPEMREPFIHGYEQTGGPVSISPEALELFDAGRNLNIMNLALLAPNSGIGEVLEPFAQRIVDWMRSSS